MSFIREISPIYQRPNQHKHRDPARAGGISTHVVHEALATKYVGEEARRVLDVGASLLANHLLAVLVIDGAQVLSDGPGTTASAFQTHTFPPSVGGGTLAAAVARTESDSTRYASLAKRKKGVMNNDAGREGRGKWTCLISLNFSSASGDGFLSG